MKKLFVCTILVGLAVGSYFAFKDRKKEDFSSQEDNSNHSSKAKEPIIANN